MIREQELKERCTPEFIKWMVELAEGFAVLYDDGEVILMDLNDDEFDLDESGFINRMSQFPLLIHRAVYGWNKKQSGKDCIVISDDNIVFVS